jgi:hypothetical protein
MREASSAPDLGKRDPIVGPLVLFMRRKMLWVSFPAKLRRVKVLSLA